MSTSGDILSTSGDAQCIGGTWFMWGSKLIKAFDLYWKPRCPEHPLMYSWYPPTCIMISPRCTHDIPPMYSWYLPDALNIPRRTHDIPRCTYGISPDVLMVFPPMHLWYSPMYLWYPPDVLNIPRCTHVIPPMSYDIPDVLNIPRYSPPQRLVLWIQIIIILRREPLPDQGRFRGHSLYFKGHCLIKSHIHHWFTYNLAQLSIITKWLFWHIINWEMSRGSGNNPQLATNSGGLPHYEFRIESGIWADLIGLFSPVFINNYIINFSSFLNKMKVKMNGF